jgi:hypothetical protein
MGIEEKEVQNRGTENVFNKIIEYNFTTLRIEMVI